MPRGNGCLSRRRGPDEQPPHGTKHDYKAARLCGESGSDHVNAPEYVVPGAKNVIVPGPIGAGRLFSIGCNSHECEDEDVPEDYADVRVLNAKTWIWEKFSDGPFLGTVTCVAAVGDYIYVAGFVAQADGEKDGNIYAMDLETKEWSHFRAGEEITLIDEMIRVGDTIITASEKYMGLIVAGENKWTPLPPVDCTPCAHIVFGHYYEPAPLAPDTGEKKEE